MKFIHAADLHIDSPLKGLDSYEGAPVERLRGATRLAMSALVDLALREAVDVVILAGDLYDQDWQDFRTGLFFREQMVRLTRAGVRVFIARGNHDAQSVITRQLPKVDGVHVFDARRAETVVLPELNLAVHGRSFPNREVPEDLVPAYPDAVPGLFNLGALHTSLAGSVDHDPYAPTSVEMLSSKGYDYFALGHVHARQVVREARPRIVYPGNLQGRFAKEVGPKGCELVRVTGGVIESAEFVELDVVRWHQLAIDVTSVDTIDKLAVAFAEVLTKAAEHHQDRLHAVRVLLHGESALHRLEAATPGTLAAAIRAAGQDVNGIEVWIEQVRLNLRSPFDRAAAAARPDAFGELVSLVDQLLADDEWLRAWADTQLDDKPKLPNLLRDADPAMLGIDELRQMVRDAEASVLSQLGDTQEDSR